MHYVRFSNAAGPIHLRSRPHSLSFLRFKYRKVASILPLPFVLFSSIKAPELSPRTKYRGSPGKKKRFPPINFRSPFLLRRSCESCESFSSPSRHIISSNHRPSLPIVSASLFLPSVSPSLPGLVQSTPLALTPSSSAIPEFVITGRAREPRDRNFAGYDIRPKSKETRRKGTIYPLRPTEKGGLNQIYRLPPPPKSPERRLGAASRPAIQHPRSCHRLFPNLFRHCRSIMLDPVLRARLEIRKSGVRWFFRLILSRCASSGFGQVLPGWDLQFPVLLLRSSLFSSYHLVFYNREALNWWTVIDLSGKSETLDREI